RPGSMPCRPRPHLLCYSERYILHLLYSRRCGRCSCSTCYTGAWHEEWADLCVSAIQGGQPAWRLRPSLDSPGAGRRVGACQRMGLPGSGRVRARLTRLRTQCTAPSGPRRRRMGHAGTALPGDEPLQLSVGSGVDMAAYVTRRLLAIAVLAFA